MDWGAGIMVKSRRAKDKVRANKYGMMGLFIKAIGRMIISMERVGLYFQMDSYTRVIGFRAKGRAKEN